MNEKKKIETGWIEDIFSVFLNDSTYHLEDNIPLLCKIIALEAEKLAKAEQNKVFDEFLKDFDRLRASY